MKYVALYLLVTEQSQINLLKKEAGVRNSDFSLLSGCEVCEELWRKVNMREMLASLAR